MIPNRTAIVTEDEVDKALDFLRDNAKTLGDARARLVRASHMVKVQEAMQFKKSDATSNDRRQADARTSTAYLEAIEEDAIATGEYEKLRALRAAAEMKIEAWRSESATYRSMKI